MRLGDGRGRPGWGQLILTEFPGSPPTREIGFGSLVRPQARHLPGWRAFFTESTVPRTPIAVSRLTAAQKDRPPLDGPEYLRFLLAIMPLFAFAYCASREDSLFTADAQNTTPSKF